ncbi:MAG: BMC domain-containing protein [Ruminococcus sp.]|nr:BMC domain-containing protein [Ruminococcus sp.]
MGEAVGMLEVYGLATAFAAADAGCKAGNVRIETFDKNKPANADELPVPLLVMIKFRGSVSDVEAALDAARAKARELAGIVNEHSIARPTEDTEKMLKLSGLDKKEK